MWTNLNKDGKAEKYCCFWVSLHQIVQTFASFRVQQYRSYYSCMSTKRVASALKGCFLFQNQKKICKWLWKKIMNKANIPVIANCLFGKPLCVSPCGCFDSWSTRFDESSFSWFFGSIFLFFVDFTVRVLRLNNFILNNFILDKLKSFINYP